MAWKDNWKDKPDKREKADKRCPRCNGNNTWIYNGYIFVCHDCDYEEGV